MAGFRVDVDRQAVEHLLTDERGPVGLYMLDLLRQVTNRAQQYCPVDTGLLRSSIEYAVRRGNGGLVGTCGTRVYYAIYVHEGWRRRRKDGGVTVVRGRPFIRQAVADITGVQVPAGPAQPQP